MTTDTDRRHSGCVERRGSPEVPPLLVVFGGGDAAVKHLPPPLVHEVAKRQEGNLVQGDAHEEVDVALCRGRSHMYVKWQCVRLRPSTFRIDQTSMSVHSDWLMRTSLSWMDALVGWGFESVDS